MRQSNAKYLVLSLSLLGFSACGEGTVAPGSPDQFLGQGDLFAPIFQLVGAPQMELERQFESYEELGATAFSFREGDLTDQILISGEVNTLVVGLYTRRYDLLSREGVRLASLTRQIQVLDRLPPTGQLQFEGTQFPINPSNEAGPRVLNLTGSNDETDRITFYRAQAFYSAEAFAADFCASQDISGAAAVPITEAFGFNAQEGYQVVCAEASDEHFNWTGLKIQSESLFVTTALPQVSISTPVDGALTNQRDLQVNGSCEAGSFFGPVRLSGSFPTQNLDCSASGDFSANVSLEGEDGSKTIQIRQFDQVGNEGSASVTITLDTTAPVIDFAAYSTVIWPLCENFPNDSELPNQVFYPTASDALSGLSLLEVLDVSASIDTQGGSIQYRATDVAGNISLATQIIRSEAEREGDLFLRGLKTPADLQQLDLSENVLFCQDIDLSGENFEALGSASEGVSVVIDGQGYSVSGLSIEAIGSPQERSDLGFVRRLGSSGLIRNLRFEGAFVSGLDRVGIVTGQNEGRIERVSVRLGEVFGRDQIGGLVGFQNSESAILKNSFAQVELEGRALVGGLVGENNQGMIETSYSVAGLVAQSFSGGLIGLNSVLDSVVSSYWNLDSSGGDLDGNPAEYGFPLTDIEMRTPSSYSDLWSTDIWEFTDGSYPVLREPTE